MYHKHHTRGIILTSKNEGDDSRRVIIFTEKFGLVNARVQGARTAKSKLRPSSQDFSLGDLSLVQGKTGWKVVSTNSEKNIFENFRNSPPKLKAVGNVLNLLRKLSGEEEEYSLLFSTIARFLEFLVDTKDESVVAAECLVLLRILNSLGYLREDVEFSEYVNSIEFSEPILEALTPKRSRMIAFINESLKATQIIT